MAQIYMMALKPPNQILQELRRYAKKFTVRRWPYLLFDAGGTIVFPNVTLMIKKLARHGWHLRPDQLYQGYYQVINRLDRQGDLHRSERKFWPKGIAYELFNEMGVIDPNTSLLAAEIQQQHKLSKNLWTFTYPWVSETLSKLRKQGYSMSILFNSDGRARQVIREVKLLPFFEDVFDSHSLKLSKPDPRVFAKVLDTLNLNPADVLYIGDIYEVDIKGANSAGIGAVHIDPLETYSDKPGIHIQDIRDLPDWLVTNYNQSTADGTLFPFRMAEKLL